MTDLTFIVEFILQNFITMLPYLLLSIPLAVLVRVTDAKRFIERAFNRNALLAILLATLVGAFSPFCSCTVIPIIASLLIAGVPLGPVMAFWIASPTMDPEIFLLSVGVLGWELAVARVVATLILSLSAGFLAHQMQQRGVFSSGIMRDTRKKKKRDSWRSYIPQPIQRVFATPEATSQGGTLVATTDMGINIPQSGGVIAMADIGINVAPADTCGCSTPVVETSCGCSTDVTDSSCGCSTDAADASCGCSTEAETPTLSRRIWTETRSATVMVMKFMLIAFLLEALITLYIPQETIINLVGSGNPAAIALAAFIGIPIYTTNLTALPLIGGLLQQGMLPGAALAFLIAGPTTTIPAMSAVFGIAKPRVFALYVSIALVGAVVLGYGYQLLV